MPELPEVETIRRGLAAVLPGRKIKAVEVRLPKAYQAIGPEDDSRVIGAMVKSVERRGKALLIGLSTGLTLLIHLKMTGQLIYREKQQIKLAGGHPTTDMVLGEYPKKSTHVIFTFDNGGELFFNDQRTFGYIKVLPTEDLGSVPLLKSLGPEPLDRTFALEKFMEMLNRRPNAKLKPLLLDQTFIAGLGNIYVDEALNLSKLHPLRTAGSLTSAEGKELFEAIKQVLRTSLKYGGTSDNTYVTIRGGKGDYLNHARAYHRSGEPCRTCGRPIERSVVAGRGTHTCPHCQKPPRVRKAVV